MLEHFRSVAARRLVIAVTVAFALWLAAPASRAQSQAGVSNVERSMEIRNADIQREMEMKRFEGMKAARADSPAARLAVEQIGEDFRRMQLVNNEMMRATFAVGAPRTLDYERISKATAEINRRASRLRTNLQLPTQGHDDARETGQEIAGERELRSSLLSLDQLIMGFVNNPTFSKQSVLDAQHSARASRDLASIIKLSQKIKQRADKLKG
ncbi:MAG: hypothetical protein QOE33_574 [Acidobacteriota bacterium]|nr:hypothetical protein [Acidobacteriota bacterium]